MDQRTFNVGIAGGRSGHAVPFAKITNGLSGPQPHDRFMITAAYSPLPSAAAALTQAVPGLRTVAGMDELCQNVDAVLVLDDEDQGGSHTWLAQLPLELGIPTFIDKPCAPTLSQATDLYSIASKSGTLLQTGSAIRFAPQLPGFKALLADADTPWELDLRGPGDWWFYGIHLAEAAVAMLGTGMSVDSFSDSGGQTSAVYSCGLGQVLLQTVGDGPELFQFELRSAEADCRWTLRPSFTRWYRGLLSAFYKAVDTGTPYLTQETQLEPLRLLETARVARPCSQLRP